MPVQYSDFSHTLFPQAVDDKSEHALMTDITADANLATAATVYNGAVARGDVVAANSTLKSTPRLIDAIFNAEKYNWMRDAILAMQRFYFEDVREHLKSLVNNTVGIDDENEHNSPGTNSYSITKINQLINGTSTNVTLSQGSWAGSAAPFTYSVNVDGVTASNNVDVSLSTNASVAQSKLWAKAMCLNATQANGKITLKAYGKKPTNDIPITITVHK